MADLDAVTRVVRDVQREHAGGPARTYLTGFSLGGNGVLDLAAAAAAGGSDLWAAYWPVDPTRLPTGARPHRPMWVSAGPLTKWNRGFVALAAADGGGAFRVTDEADDHDEAAARAYGRAEVYDWLLSHRL